MHARTQAERVGIEHGIVGIDQLSHVAVCTAACVSFGRERGLAHREYLVLPLLRLQWSLQLQLLLRLVGKVLSVLALGWVGAVKAGIEASVVRIGVELVEHGV